MKRLEFENYCLRLQLKIGVEINNEIELKAPLYYYIQGIELILQEKERESILMLRESAKSNHLPSLILLHYLEVNPVEKLKAEIQIHHSDIRKFKSNPSLDFMSNFCLQYYTESIYGKSLAIESIDKSIDGKFLPTLNLMFSVTKPQQEFREKIRRMFQNFQKFKLKSDINLASQTVVDGVEQTLQHLQFHKFEKLQLKKIETEPLCKLLRGLQGTWVKHLHLIGMFPSI